ncbi:MAG: menaquinol oxidoreductase, partial [Candidatus Zixiibacteriota bacterium]
MGALISLIAVVILILLAFLGAGLAGWHTLFGIIVPYAAAAIFIIGVIYRVVKWARSPVPFRVPTTCGQQKSLPWLKSDNLESPHNTLGVVGRMVLEVLFFRSLFRNTRSEVREGPKLTYSADKWLWAAGLAFHWSFLIILIRHVKYFIEPVPPWILTVQHLDGFFQVGLPIILATDVVILVAPTFLFMR